MSIQNRYDFILLFDVKDGNPNGDPDAGNLPRLDPETGEGITTDVCLKRKIRNYVYTTKNNLPRFDIYVKEKAILNQLHDRAYEALSIKTEEDSKGKKKRLGGGVNVDNAQAWMCDNFYDVRTFGAVMSTGKNCGQVRGPVQITFARSIDPVLALEHTITRVAVATEKEAEKQKGGNRTMGHKHTIPYGLYRAHGFISANLAEQTNFSEEDLSLFWDALRNMFELDHSAARGEMNVRGLYVFKHDSKLGNAPAHELFNRIEISRKDKSLPVRKFSDYIVTINQEHLPAGVHFIQMVG